MTIPIENVYFLLCYAWNHAQQKDLVDLTGRPARRPEDLFAHILAEGVARVMRQGLDRGYVEKSEDVGGIRGKLVLSATLKRNLLVRAATHCQFEELQYDVLHNQILKATLAALIKIKDLDTQQRARVTQLRRRFEHVSHIELTRRHFRSVQIHRNNRQYDFLLRLCLLIHLHLLVEEKTGTTRFHDFRRDEATMWRVFEDFIFNFYRREQTAFRVTRPHIQWNDVQGSEAALRLLPRMRTDVFLESRERRIILDCKYATRPFSVGRFGEERVRASNLYQLFAYLLNRAANEGQNPPHEGLLLYPVVAQQFDLRYHIMGHPISVRSIDLGQPWNRIHEDLLAIIA